jgi:preprotein translocase subunit SecD
VSTKNIIKLIVIIALVFLIAYVLIFGVSFGVYDIGNIEDNMTYGLDLTGGVYVVLEAQDTEDNPVTQDKMDSTIAAITERIDGLGLTEPTITQQGENRIRVSIPDIEDQEEALSIIGKTAQLEFIDPNGEVILTGENVVESQAIYQESSTGIQEPVVTLVFDEEGTELFAEATTEFVGDTIEIVLDDEVISSPVVNSAITDGEAVINGMEDLDEAGELSSLINGGALPLELEAVEVRTVGPTLGQDSLESSIFAGAIGISLILIYMFIYYRIPGLVADLSLVIYIMIVLLIMSSLNVTLTLPGIAGFILSIGMAVDANVIIFERIKEELRSGHSLLISIDRGFNRALSTILDSNITTMIAGIVLFYMGSGTVQGFAVTLILGLVVSMFCALFVTRNILKTVVRTGLFKNKRLYGYKEVQE